MQLVSSTQGIATEMPPVQTDATGRFAFTGLNSADWQLQPQKSGGLGNAITALDAVYILQAAVRLRTLSPEQMLACDVTGNGAVTALDATLILRYKVGLITSFPVSQKCGSDWAFVPEPDPASNQEVLQPALSPTCQNGTIAFHPLMDEADNQNFSAALFGDCSGNWQPTGGSSAAALSTSERSNPEVRLGRHLTRGRRVHIPLLVDHTDGYRSLDARIYYDATRLGTPRLRRANNAAQALIAVNDRVPGTLVVSLASGQPLRGGEVAVLEFEAKDRHSRGAQVQVLDAAVGNE